MQKNEKIDILIGTFTAAGISFILSDLTEFISKIFEESIIIHSYLYGVLWIIQIALTLLIGLYLWKKVNLTKYFSYTFLGVIILSVILNLIFYINTFIKLYT